MTDQTLRCARCNAVIKHLDWSDCPDCRAPVHVKLPPASLAALHLKSPPPDEDDLVARVAAIDPAGWLARVERNRSNGAVQSQAEIHADRSMLDDLHLMVRYLVARRAAAPQPFERVAMMQEFLRELARLPPRFTESILTDEVDPDDRGLYYQSLDDRRRFLCRLGDVRDLCRVVRAVSAFIDPAG